MAAETSADGLYLVVSQSGSEYLVDYRTGRCGCPDAEHRDSEGGCKHVRRVAFATGDQSVPAVGVDVDPHLAPTSSAPRPARKSADRHATNRPTSVSESTGVQKL